MSKHRRRKAEHNYYVPESESKKGIFATLKRWFGVDDETTYESEKESSTTESIPSPTSSTQSCVSSEPCSVITSHDTKVCSNAMTTPNPDAVPRRRRPPSVSPDFSTLITEPPRKRRLPPVDSPSHTTKQDNTNSLPVKNNSSSNHPTLSTAFDFDRIIQRYLTTAHSQPSTMSVMGYYEHCCAEMDYLLKSIPQCHVVLRDEKVLRNKEILTPYERTALVTNQPKQNLSHFIVVDTETTGIRVGGNDIIEVSAIKFENFIPVAAFTTLLKPRKPIPEDATRVNGITDEMVQDAPLFAQIRTSLEQFIGNYPVVAHNADFDIRFLHVSGLRFPENTLFYDTLSLCKRHIPYASYKLLFICGHCNIHFKGAHRSMSDALATGLLFIEIIKTAFGVKNIYDITFAVRETTPPAKISAPLIDSVTLEEKNSPVVTVFHSTGRIEKLPLDSELPSKVSCLLSEGGKTYHTHLDCFTNWPSEYQSGFTGWQMSNISEAINKGYRKCKYCEKRDVPRSSPIVKEPVYDNDDEDEEWQKYKHKKPAKTFTITCRDEFADASDYTRGDEVEIGYDYEKDKDTIEVNYDVLCYSPKSVQDFFEDKSYVDYCFFVLDSYESDSGKVKVKIGIFEME